MRRHGGAVRLDFVTVDVFTDRQFGGNPLAVVPDARALTSAQMQAIAEEFNLAETTFVLPPQDPANTAQVRIFTPRAEMPFAGHPNVGTAFALAQAATASAARPAAGDTMTFEEKAGIVRITLLNAGARVTGARLAAPQDFSIVGDIVPEIVATACGVAVDDIHTHAHMPCVASCGAPFVLVELKSRAALAAARPRAEIFAEHLPLTKATGIHLYVQTATADVDLETRMFAPLHGIAEDPATGSANVALIGLLATLRPEPDFRLEQRISQGVDMGRPSLMLASAEKRAGSVVATYIGGTCVPVMRGIITLD
jgi:trans-2,3-dihydro-3-hydroxyanthranilate isomerase